jgi:hypothetical protein
MTTFERVKKPKTQINTQKKRKRKINIKTMHLKFIVCDVLYREACYLAATSKNKIDLEFLPKGLHDLETTEMNKKLQDAVDRASENNPPYDAIILGYALCNNGTAGLKARNIPVVIPKAHDCITLFMGSRKKYAEYFDANPGVYFHTTGWLERSQNSDEFESQSIQAKTGMNKSYEELVQEYGEDNAQYLYETLCQGTVNYEKIAFIEMGIEPDNSFEEQSKADAQKQGWKFEKIKGDISLLRRLAEGNWDDCDFLQVLPGATIQPSYDDSVMKCSGCAECSK